MNRQGETWDEWVKVGQNREEWGWSDNGGIGRAKHVDDIIVALSNAITLLSVNTYLKEFKMQMGTQKKFWRNLMNIMVKEN